MLEGARRGRTHPHPGAAGVLEAVTFGPGGSTSPLDMPRRVTRNRRSQLMSNGALRLNAQVSLRCLDEEATGPRVPPAHPSRSQEVKFKSKAAPGLGTQGTDIFGGQSEPVPDNSIEAIRAKAPAFNLQRWPLQKLQGCAHRRISVTRKEKSVDALSRRAYCPPKHLGRPLQHPEQNQAAPLCLQVSTQRACSPGEEAEAGTASLGNAVSACFPAAESVVIATDIPAASHADRPTRPRDLKGPSGRDTASARGPRR